MTPERLEEIQAQILQSVHEVADEQYANIVRWREREWLIKDARRQRRWLDSSEHQKAIGGVDITGANGP